MSKKTKHHNPILDGLMERRTVILDGKINNTSISDVGRRLVSLQMQSLAQINLLIDSGGGSLDAALRLCDLITTIMTAPVRGIAIGECGSAATFIMLHCQQRFGTPYSRFLIHSGMRSEIALPINGSTSENLEQLLYEAKATDDMVVQLYMNRLTPSSWTPDTHEVDRRRYVQGLITRGDQRFNSEMMAKEAVDVGLIEGVIYDKLDIFPS